LLRFLSRYRDVRGASYQKESGINSIVPELIHNPQHLPALGIERVVLPPRSPNLNAYAERWVRSVKDEALSRMILFGENSLWHVLNEYVDHYHQERNHQGKGNVLLFPLPSLSGDHDGLIQCRERLGGLLKYYEREAA